jgi:hypothetical protein
MMPRHKMGTSKPLTGFFPYPPPNLDADLVIIHRQLQQPPPDAAGPPLRENGTFALYRITGDPPGPDMSSRKLVYDVQDITL